MVDSQSITTFSGIFVFLALVAVFNRCFTLSGLLLTVAGAAGIGVFWERWSRLTGYEVQIRALWHPVAPTHGQIWLVATHGVLLLLGMALIVRITQKRQEEDRG